MNLTFSMEPWYNKNFCDLNMKGINALYWKCHALIDVLRGKSIHDEGKDFLVSWQLNVIKEMLKIARANNASLEQVEQGEDFVRITLSFPSNKDEDAFIEQNTKKAPLVIPISIPLSKEVAFTGGRSLIEALAYFFYNNSKENVLALKKEYENAWGVIKAAQTSMNNMILYSSYDEEKKELELMILFENADAYKAFINNSGYLKVS